MEAVVFGCGGSDVLHVCVQPSPVTQTPNLAEANAAEEDKIKAMMIQSCRYYEPLK